MYARDTALIATPIGGIRIEGDETTIHAIRIEPGAIDTVAAHTSVVRHAAAQIAEWFAGTRCAFDMPLAPAKTARGQVLRDGMTSIPYGDTVSYGALANTLASSPRALGQACARNPFPIVVPCHRVLGAGGAIGHYSGGGGITTKRWLLAHEQKILAKEK